MYIVYIYIVCIYIYMHITLYLGKPTQGALHDVGWSPEEAPIIQLRLRFDPRVTIDVNVVGRWVDVSQANLGQWASQIGYGLC